MSMFDAVRDLGPYLSPGERVLWEGRSQRRLRLATNGGLFFLMFFVAIAALVLVIFAVTASGGGLESDDARVGLVVLPIVFLAVGLGVGIPLIVASRRNADGRYVVTSSAAMIVNSGGWNGRQVQVVPLKNLSAISLIENRDGTGTLVFGQNPAWAATMRYPGMWSTGATPVFWNIERPVEVYQLVRRQMGEA